MGAAVLLLFFVAGLALIFHADRRTRQRRKELLDGLARFLQSDPPPRGATAVAGTRVGQPVTFRLTYHGSGKSRRPFTEIDAPLPSGAFSLELRWQSYFELRRVKKGLAIDLQTGDQTFDDAFIVEAAPADVALALLTPDLRRDLLAFKPNRVRPIGGALRLEQTGHVLDLGAAVGLCDVAARLAGGVRSAHVAADAALEAALPASGGPFRAETDASEIQARKAARSEELVALTQLRGRREARERLIGMAILVVTIVAGAVIVTLR